MIQRQSRLLHISEHLPLRHWRRFDACSRLRRVARDWPWRQRENWLSRSCQLGVFLANL